MEDLGSYTVANCCSFSGLLVERSKAQGRNMACQRRQPVPWEAPEGQDEDSASLAWASLFQ